MNKSLSTFMGMAAIVLIMISLIFGIAYAALDDKNETHEELLQTEHQLEPKK